MYVITAIDGLLVEQQVAIRDLKKAKEVFCEWAKALGIPIEPGKNTCKKNAKVVSLIDCGNPVSTVDSLYVITSIYLEYNMKVSIYRNFKEAIEQYLRTLHWVSANVSSRDIDGWDFINHIMLIMDFYKSPIGFNYPVICDNASVIFRTLKVV